jgi:hypothetical protein
MQYEVLVDTNARHRNLPENFTPQSFYGQLQHIYLVRFIQPCPALGLEGPTTIIMAAIRVCKVDPTIQIPHLDFHFYSGFGKLDVVDITCLQCLVARVPDLDTQNLWAIADRSGNLARAVYLQDS